MFGAIHCVDRAVWLLLDRDAKVRVITYVIYSIHLQIFVTFYFYINFDHSSYKKIKL
jgi:hypothetical protein